jgi:signal peptide peptidase SppA
MTQDGVSAVLGVIGDRLGISQVNGQALVSVTDTDTSEVTSMAMHPDEGMASGRRKPYSLGAGIAVIPIHGTIVQRFDHMNAACGLVSSQAISNSIISALHDPDVKGIYLDVDSPGGEAAGVFEALEVIRNAKTNSGKIIHAHANELAASAAYAFASVADHLSMPNLGLVGSIGVLIIHADMSDFYQNQGVNVRVFRKGDHKASTNSFEPLSDSAQTLLQKLVDDSYEAFVDNVVQNRARLTPQAIMDTQSAVLTSDQAIEVGLVDAIMTEDQAVTHLLTSIS